MSAQPIVCHPDYLQLSLAAAKALLAFASDDATRPALGIGIDAQHVGATDGHAAMRFERAAIGFPNYLKPYTGKSWSHDYVATALKIARAKKAATVELPFDALREGFAPLCRVWPEYDVDAHEPIRFDPMYIAALAHVAKACGTKGVELSSARAELDPLAFRIDGPEGTASVVLMPMRK